MVRDAALREVVGPDALGAVACAHLRAALVGKGGVLLVLLHLEEAGAKNLETLGLVLVLRLFVLTADHEAGGDVGHAYGGVGRVHALPAGA